MAHRFREGKGPDVIVHLGDLWDMHSLSSYDSAARKAFERRSYEADKAAGNEWLTRFHDELAKGQVDASRIDFHFMTGNHENRANVWTGKDPSFAGYISNEDVTAKLVELGWKVHPFLQPVKLDGIQYCHFFPLNAQGRVSNNKNGCTSAEDQAIRCRGSATAGHRQGLDMAILDGNPRVRGLIAGSFYLHDEDYMTPMGNSYWRGVIMKNDVRCGDYSISEVSLEYLKREYG